MICVCLCVCVCTSGASGVSGVRPAAAEEAGLSGYIRRRDDRGGEGRRRSGTTPRLRPRKIRRFVSSVVNVSRLCLQCVAESVVHIEEIDTEVVMK